MKRYKLDTKVLYFVWKKDIMVYSKKDTKGINCDKFNHNFNLDLAVNFTYNWIQLLLITKPQNPGSSDIYWCYININYN